MASGRLSEHYLAYLLNRADHALSSPLHASLAARGVQVSDWRVLAILNDYGRCTVGELAGHVRLPQPTITHAIARLEKKGQVVRVSGVEDRRQRFVTLTPEGQAAAREVVALAEQHERQALANFADPDGMKAELESVLSRLIEGLEATEPGDGGPDLELG